MALFALALVASASAQTATVSGTVLDADGAPLAGASVYLSGTTRGDAADREGRFEILNVDPGAYRLVASLVGYDPALEDITLTPGADLEVTLTLEAGLELGDVEVEAEFDDAWLGQFDRFFTAIVGESWRSDSTLVLNPEVLSFQERGNLLTATASAPVVFENRALGYRLTYDLRVFEARPDRIRYDGDELFEDLEPASWRDTERWRQERVAAYSGSGNHFFRSLLAGTFAEEGFSISLIAPDRRSVGPAPDDLFTVRDDGWGTLRAPGVLMVTYAEEEDPAYLWSEWFQEDRDLTSPIQRSFLQTEETTVLVDPQGTPTDPFAISAGGYLGFERLADRVPEDYDPDGPGADEFAPTDF
ncbi:carboxypeptidase-like regulatory domain-containing protein [Rubrivirga sp.]|uniref:carboxypeptidase-like regulatory domain-containing protein n=1 Tax=Rubrivirga sp. TaxID=1885344 RepID=UPI003C77C184